MQIIKWFNEMDDRFEKRHPVMYDVWGGICCIGAIVGWVAFMFLLDAIINPPM